MEGVWESVGNLTLVETVDVPDQVDAADIKSGLQVNRSIGVTNISEI